MPTGVRRTIRILGLGIREIDEQLLYSAAWLDDLRPNPGMVRFGAFESALRPLAAVLGDETQSTDDPRLGTPVA
jgi:hypothetical protein